MQTLIQQIPKAELHIHIEGSLEPDMMFRLAERNAIELPFDSVKELQAAYSFSNLQSFLDIYYQGTQVLCTKQDFYDMTWSYLNRASADSVRHCEIFFDPQSHTARGISFATVVEGISAALADGAKKLNISSHLIMCFLRHLSQEEAMDTLTMALDYKDKIIGVGLDSSEIGHPPKKFQEVFTRARKEGFRAVAHAGEEGPADYIWQALDLLQVERIDHGIACLQDSQLVNHLRDQQIPLTVCPLSNVKLAVFQSAKEHNLKAMLDQGLCVTINSDDPAYFGGYINANFIALADQLTTADIAQLAKNSFQASFLEPEQKQHHINHIEEHLQG